ncbi:MAG: 16S rRNA (guanine(966)-N(2))-methyltransferase RsmD [Candidatus Caldatribacteriota bacterium]|nr:16S rRNA (guanine(966)-N(2))-methyltransferase RsmD [Candidatus Caldatribacteriota bacterium]
MTSKKVKIMRIVAGKNKGNILKSPRDLSVRPTSEKVREALFDILGSSVRETIFLDLFAGTGAVGIEALSRGAKKVIFIEKEPKCIKIIKENLEKTGNIQNAVVYKIDFLPGLKLLARKNYLLDYIFLDPPYNKGLVNISLLEISNLPILRKSGWIIVQHYKKEKVIKNLSNLRLFDQRRYGECYLSFYEYVNIESVS